MSRDDQEPSSTGGPALPVSFLSGGGHAGELIRAYPWTETQLGPPESWPPALKTAVELMLAARQPVYIAWGPDLVSLYNDAYLPIVGSKHPGIGRPYRELWSEIMDQFGPILETTLSGEAQHFVDLPIAIAGRAGVPVGYFTFSYLPLRGPSGGIEGFYCAATETTSEITARRQQGFRLALTEELHRSADPELMMDAACRLLGEHLGVARVGFADVEDDETHIQVRRDWNDGRLPSVLGRWCMVDFGPAFMQQIKAGETIAVPDVERDERTCDAVVLGNYRQIGTRAILNRGLIRGGRMVALLFIHHPVPREWVADDIALVEETTQRLWSAVERTRAEQAFRNSERLARTRAEELEAIYAAAPVGLCVLDRELRFVRINDRLAEMNGIPAADHIGRTVREVVPDLNRQALETLERVLAGESMVGVNFVGTTPAQPGVVRTWRENWLPLRDLAGEVVGVTISAEEVTAEKVAQTALTASEERLALAVEGSRLGLWEYHVATADGTWSDRMFHIHGLPPRARLGRDDWLGLVHPEDRERVAADLDGHVTGSGPFTATFRIVRPDGETRLLDVYGTSDGQRAVGICADVTERRSIALERDRAEAALVTSEQRLRAAIRASESGTFYWNIQSGELDWDQALDRLFGLTPSQTARSLDQFLTRVHPDDRARVAEAWEACARDGVDLAEEFRIFLPDGQVRWLYDRGKVLPGPGGSPLSMVGACVDITDRRAAEEKLRETSRRLDAVLENASVAIFLMDDRQQCIYMNYAAEELTGYSFAETQGRPLHDVIHHTYPDGQPFPLEECAIDRAFPENANTRGEEVFVHKDGSFYPVSFVASPIRDEASRTVGTIIEVRDIREEKERELALRTAETALAASEAKFQAIADSIDQMIWSTQPDGYHDYFNHRWYEFTGVPEGSTDGEGWNGIFHPDDQERAWARWGQSLATGEPYEIEYRLRHHSGGYRWVLGRARPIRDERGRIVRWYGSCTDIQEQRATQDRLRDLNATLAHRVEAAVAEREQAQAQLFEAQKLETIGQLTGGIAHDFNNLLTPVIGSLDLLLRRHVDDRSQRLLGGALQSADRARILVQRLMAFARRQTLKPEPINTAELMEGMKDLIGGSIGPTVTFDIDVPRELPAAVVDPNQLELALLNLCVNARDAMPGGGKISIVARAESIGEDAVPGLAAGNYVRIVVSDTGSGMDAETLRRAIEPFFTTKPTGHGTGLGLSMVHGLAAQSGGVFRLFSQVGVGTTAALWLPASDGQRLAEPNQAQEQEAVPRAPRGATVLLVDDEQLVRGSVADGLRELGYEVVEAESGFQALRLVQGGLRPDLLVTDQLMPGMTGRTLADELRSALPALPVLVVTGYANFKAEELAGVQVLAKPFRLAELARRLGELLDEGESNVIALRPR